MRILSKKVNDDRFLGSDAISRYSEIIENRPSQKKERLQYENTNWYKIYDEHKKDGDITQAQTDYLLCRDLFIETLEFIVLYMISLYVFNGTVLFSWHFILTLLVMAVITNVSTHIKMNRFVNTVIAVDISKTQNWEGFIMSKNSLFIRLEMQKLACWSCPMEISCYLTMLL